MHVNLFFTIRHHFHIGIFGRDLRFLLYIWLDFPFRIDGQELHQMRAKVKESTRLVEENMRVCVCGCICSS